MKKLITLILLTMAATIAATAQSAKKITQIDNSPEATFGQLSYLIGTDSAIVSDDMSEQQSFEILQKRDYFDSFKSADSDAPVTFAQMALVCSKNWKISESLLYKLTGSSRYAFKQLQALEIIPASAYPNAHPTGHQLLNIITLCIDYSSKKDGE